MILEIKVHDTIETFDTLVKALEYVEELIRKWIVSGEEKPLQITLVKKNETRGPPSLKISVGDSISSHSGLA